MILNSYTPLNPLLNLQDKVNEVSEREVKMRQPFSLHRFMFSLNLNSFQNTLKMQHSKNVIYRKYR